MLAPELWESCLHIPSMQSMLPPRGECVPPLGDPPFPGFFSRPICHSCGRHAEFMNMLDLLGTGRVSLMV